MSLSLCVDLAGLLFFLHNKRGLKAATLHALALSLCILLVLLNRLQVSMTYGLNKDGCLQAQAQ